jgi:hypothetical protein
MVVYEFHDTFYATLPQARHAALKDFQNNYPFDSKHCGITEKILPIDRYVSKYQLTFKCVGTGKVRYRKRSIIIHETNSAECRTGIDLRGF